MDKKSYLEKRNAVLTEAENLLNEGKLDEYNNKVKEIDDLDEQFEKFAKAQANINALKDKKPIDNGLIDNENIDIQDKNIGIIPGGDGSEEYKNFGEFMKDVRFNPNGKRMMAYREKSNASMGEGSDLGILVPEQFGQRIFKFDPEAAMIRPRATVIPAGDPPDASITFPALSQGSKGAYSGVQVVWTAEGETMSETDAELSDIKLEPNEVSAYITVTNKLLRNAEAASTFLENLLRSAVINAEEYKFVQGSGAGCPLGIIKSNGAIVISRNTSASILYEDVLGMEAVMMPNFSNLLWIASQSAYTDIKDMKDASSNRIYQDANLVKGQPANLDGIPLKWTGRCPTLGNKGDLMLVQLENYLIKDGSGPFVAASEHVEFKANKTVIKIVWNVDGQTWNVEPLTLEDGSTQVSPFVVLQ